ncbi:acyl-CoA synthetase (AMP-forming)/AMP-acid ligase II [Sphingopyxis panaciterrae]|uniref:class I adenylate-forming enzyme family protein n=1 Tax=Sphingopyxis panaciterrae TaxID=363841 RepID=UPI00141EE34B|nr:AMP-binding protein [Sphingopyxis panaciterrae]NIJ36795.1 acyl-CoA synthetase (AMP-forming)/AMP-acid ligase II [Sphingopyxis panaciterrae]
MRTPLLLDIAADACPERLALGGSGDGMDFHAYRARASRVAAWLLSEGKANTAFLGMNGDALPVLLFASGMAGTPFVPLNYRLADADLNKLVARSAPAVLIADDDMLRRIAPVDGVELVARSRFEAEFMTGGARAKVDLPEAENDIAVLLFTSGTTGDPKAAVLRHANLTSYVMATVEFLGADEDQAALVSVPSYHIAGISAILTSAYGGRRIVYLPAFTAEDWVRVAAAEAITHAMVVPTMLDRILDVMVETGETLPALRALSYGGGKMPEPVIARALAMLPQVDFVNAYGLTETSSTIALLGADDHRAAFASDDPAIRRRIASVGQPLPSIELEIRREDGSPCGPGEHGEIHVRGEQVSGEYLHRKAIADDGWFATNDAGWLDDGGYLFVEGRLDDVIVRGGENISPGEIEDVLRGFDDIADCAVLGIPCVQWGEKVVAVIVSRSGAPDTVGMAATIKARLRSTKTPEQWFVRSELPYNETGKLLRRVLKAELAEEVCAG